MNPRQIPGSVTRVPDLLSKSPTNICLLSNCVGINRITFVSTNEMDFSKPAIIFTTDRQWRYLSVRLQNLIQHWTLKMVTTTKKKIKEKDMFGFNVRSKWQHECEGVVLEDIEGWCCWWWWNDQWCIMMERTLPMKCQVRIWVSNECDMVIENIRSEVKMNVWCIFQNLKLGALVLSLAKLFWVREWEKIIYLPRPGPWQKWLYISVIFHNSDFMDNGWNI